ncbi:MAG TPA: hypothetical protein VK524_17795 [Polyangiaceae bacterium]|nr:hypothetical protein [Polyangiaceae bacterium]
MTFKAWIAASIVSVLGMTALAACGGDDDEEKPNGAASCDAIGALLDNINATLACQQGGDSLKAQCRAGVSNRPSCGSTVDPLLQCAKREPTSNWSCNAQGFPALPLTSCSTQNAAMANCFSGQD